jgi:hypothetical protein
MGDHKEELAACCSAKKGLSRDGRADLSSANATSTKYSSPTRVSKYSKKRTQVLSPAAHYASRPSGDDNSTSVNEFFEPGGDAKETLAQATTLSNWLAV